MAVPVRTIDCSSFTGDAWAVSGSQVAPPADIRRLVVTSTPVFWRIVPIDSHGQPVTDTTTTVSACLIMLDIDENGVATLAGTISLAECTGQQQLTGAQLDDGVAPGQVFVPAIPGFTRGTSSFLEIYIDAGAAWEP